MVLFLVHFLVFCQDGWVYCDASVLLTSHLAFFAPVALSGHFSLQAHVRLALSCQAYPFWPRQNTPASAGVHDPRNPNPALPINKARVASHLLLYLATSQPSGRKGKKAFCALGSFSFPPRTSKRRDSWRVPTTFDPPSGTIRS